MNINEKSEKYKQEFEGVFSEYITSRYKEDHDLDHACSYALRGEGKRIRPLLAMLANQALQGDLYNSLPGAIAIEMIHTYSLIHDDLPCLDDDNERRGRPTLHVKFNEPTALLAGDALLTDAFSTISEVSHIPRLHSELSLDPSQKLAMVQELAEAAGGRGMVLGQMMDLYWTAKQGASKKDLDFIHLNKTGQLISVSLVIGAISAKSHTKEDIEVFRNVGKNLGLAFQIIDDLLDNTKGMGKSRGKDREQGKLTYLSLMSEAEARKLAIHHTDEAIRLLSTFKENSQDLISLAEKLKNRHH